MKVNTPLVAVGAVVAVVFAVLYFRKPCGCLLGCRCCAAAAAAAQEKKEGFEDFNPIWIPLGIAIVVIVLAFGGALYAAFRDRRRS
jgi:hypothetical protein